MQLKIQGKEIPIIYYEYSDPQVDVHGWKDESETREFCCEEIITVGETGFLINETKKYIHIAQSVYFSDGEIHTNGRSKVPKSIITKRIIVA